MDDFTSSDSAMWQVREKPRRNNDAGAHSHLWLPKTHTVLATSTISSVREVTVWALPRLHCCC